MAEKSNEVMRCMLFYYSHFQSFYNSIRFFINDSQPEISSDVEESPAIQVVSSRALLPEMEESPAIQVVSSRALFPEMEESPASLYVSGSPLPPVPQ